MGKANAPLPDPLSSPTPSTAGADDLLSQLAGDEIDRLLAEADVDAPSPSQPTEDIDSAIAAAAKVPDVTEAPTDPAKDAMRILDAVQKDADAIKEDVQGLTANPAAAVAPALPASIATESPVPAAADASASINSELDDLFKQLTERPEATSSAVEAPPPPPPVQDATPAVAAPAAAAPPVEDNGVAAEAKAVAAERAGLGLADLASSYATAKTPATAHASDEGRVPLLLRPLEWMSAPLADAPDTVRDFMGKVAIVTLVNAAAVLVYVLVFRK